MTEAVPQISIFADIPAGLLSYSHPVITFCGKPNVGGDVYDAACSRNWAPQGLPTANRECVTEFHLIISPDHGAKPKTKLIPTDSDSRESRRKADENVECL